MEAPVWSRAAGSVTMGVLRLILRKGCRITLCVGVGRMLDGHVEVLGDDGREVGGYGSEARASAPI